MACLEPRRAARHRPRDLHLAEAPGDRRPHGRRGSRRCYRLLLNKYYVDEFYDVTVVQPVKIVSEDGLWRGMDVRVVDGAVNGTGQVVGGMSAVLRLLQSGSVKAYAASTFLGVVAILAYYLWR